MNPIVEITKNTYDITFSSEVDYEWHKIAELFITSDDLYNDLNNNSLINNNESKKNVLYWQDMFFMEIVENRKELSVNNTLAEKIEAHPLYQSNLKFISQLPAVTKGLGRELLIDAMIANKNADELITDEMLGDVLKKKSREELRKKFDEWGNETIKEEEKAVNYSLETRQKKSKSNRFSYIKYLIAACFIGAMAVLGYFSLNNSYDFNDTQFVEISKKRLLRESGLGYSNNTDIDSVTIRIFDYKKADSADGKISDDLRKNTYLFNAKDLKLVLLEVDTKNIQLLKLENNHFYLRINEDYYKLKKSDDFQNLKKLKNQKLILELERIIFENE